MKKSIKKSSRRKWVVGGVAFFGSIALLTTGFATWVVGVNDNNESPNVNVNVETTENASVSFTMTYASANPDNTITIDEPKPYSFDGNKIINPGEGESKFDFTVTFESVNITIGHAAQKNNGYDGIKFAITGTNNEIESEGNKLGTARSGDVPWTYLAAPATKTFEELGLTDVDGTSAITWTGSKVPITFGWGTFFDGDTPCTYYNTLYNGNRLSSIGDDSKIVDAIYSEMSAMETAFTTTNTITLTATLVDTTPTPSVG